MEKEVREFFPPLIVETLSVKEVRNVLVAGGAGYIGSILVRKLLGKGYKVTVLDKLLFGESSIKELESNLNFKFINGDIFDNDMLLNALTGVDAVVNMAAIVGESACVCQKDIALHTNYLGAVYIARICKTLGIKKFIQASTCSTYGQIKENMMAKEDSKLFPVDFYGETKIYAEKKLMRLADENFMPTILRFSTLYGLSPRMRFDLVVNDFVKMALKEKEITIFGGNQWRPLLHVSDAAEAIYLVLKAPFAKVANQIFNVGANSENYKISDLGALVKEIIPDVKIKTINNTDDKRSYRVDFTKIKKKLGFKPKKTIKDGIVEIKNAIKDRKIINLEKKEYYNHLVV